MYGEIAEVVVFSPNRGVVVVGCRRKYTVGCGAGRGGRPGVSFSLAEIVPVSCGIKGRSGGRRREYRLPRLSWRSTEGSVDGGLALVKVRTPSEGLPHACRGFCSRGRYGELAAQWWEQHQACLHRASQVPTGPEQCRE